MEAAATTPLSAAQRPGILDKRYRAKGFRIGSRNSEVGSPLLGRTCHRNAPPPDDGDDSSELSAIDDHAYQWMSGRIWIGDHRPQGQILVTRYLRKRNITEGVALRFAEEESTGPGEAIKTIGGIPLYCARPRVAFSEDNVFQAGEGMKDPNPAWIVEGVVAQMTWPPLTIPADDRTCVRGFQPGIEDNDGGDDERESFDLFCLSRGLAGKKRTTYAALGRELYTPNEERPYSGIWTGVSPGNGYQFLLFHQLQENPNRLEVVKLTGDPGIPRGERLLLVESLSATEEEFIDTGSEWWGKVPAVAAEVQMPRGHPLLSPVLAQAKLALISHSHVIIYLTAPEVAIEVRRLDLKPFLEEDLDL